MRRAWMAAFGSGLGLCLCLCLCLCVCLGACASAPQKPACEESRNVRCMTEVKCVYDAARGCSVCRCAPPPFVPSQKLDPRPVEDGR